MKMNRLLIGMAIKKVREMRGLTQSQLSHHMSCPRSYISKIENGICLPRLGAFLSFAEALNIEAWRLLRWAERRSTETPAPSPKVPR
jgi:transcriptional regulator with XRE-family HTH domain